VVGVVARRDLLSVFLQADAAIRRKMITAVLRGTFNLPAGAIEVDVDDGVVTLAGRVPWRSTVREIVDRVCALGGVVDVVDRLSWAHANSADHAATPWAGS
jgi:osmotically-inducible protein OsmY